MRAFSLLLLSLLCATGSAAESLGNVPARFLSLETLGLLDVHIQVRRVTQEPLDPAADGVLGAVLFGTENFEVQEVDETTLALGPDGAGIAHTTSLQLRDVDEDGWLDLVALYPFSESGVAPSDDQVCLTGESFRGRPFKGCTGSFVLGGDQLAENRAASPVD